MTLIATDSNRNTPNRLNNIAIANGKTIVHCMLCLPPEMMLASLHVQFSTTEGYTFRLLLEKTSVNIWVRS